MAQTTRLASFGPVVVDDDGSGVASGARDVSVSSPVHTRRWWLGVFSLFL